MQVTDHTEGLVPGPGLYRMPAAVYHADPAPEPSLSRSAAVTLLTQRPIHVWHGHPRLGASSDDQKKRKLDVGSVAHELLTGQGRGIHAIAATDKAGDPVETYQSKAAQTERDEALAAHLTPVLKCDLLRAEKMVDAVRLRLSRIEGAEGAFQDGMGEVAAVWRDRTGIYGRCMLDWWGPTPYDVWDLKTTAGGLSDRDLANRIEDGLDVQGTWYPRGLTTLHPELLGRIRFNFVFVEDKPPFECRVVRLSGDQQYRGTRKLTRAAVLFGEYLRSGIWPGYPDTIDTVEGPDWHGTRWDEREQTDPLFREHATKILLAESPYAPAEDAA